MVYLLLVIIPSFDDLPRKKFFNELSLFVVDALSDDRGEFGSVETFGALSGLRYVGFVCSNSSISNAL